MNWLRVGTATLRVPLSGIAALIDRAQTITGLWTFSRGASAPFAVANSGAAVVTNLDADKLDGSHAAAFAASGHTHAGAVDVNGTPVAGRVASWTDADTVQDAGYAASDVARLSQANVFAAAQTLPNTGLHILDTNASHDLIIAPGSDLTVDRTLTVTTGDSDRTLTLTGNATLNQDVSTAGSPSFAQVSTPAIVAPAALTITPAAGSGVNIVLSTTGDFVVNTNQLYVDTSTGFVGVGAGPGAKLDVSSTSGGAGSGLRIIQANENVTAAFSYAPIDFTVPTSGLIGQILTTANNYVPGGFTSLAANSMAVVAEATSGQLLLGAGGASGYVSIISGGYAAANERVRITSSGNIVIGATSALGKLDTRQASTTGAIPTLYLQQADVSEEMIEFDTTIGVGNAIEAVGAKVLTTTHFIKVTIPGGLTRYIPVGTIA